MANRVRRVSSGRSQRAPTNWGGTVAPALVTIPTLTKVLLATFAPEYVSGEVIRRLRGTFFVKGAGGASYHGAVGFYVASDTSIVAGVASLLDPVTNVGEDAWLWYHSYSGDGLATAGGLISQLITIDGKAMRRIETGYSLVCVAANSNAANAYTVALSVRVLGSEAR